MKKSGKTNESHDGAPFEPPTDARSHTECFAQGMRLFSTGDYGAAYEVMYARMCRQKLDRQRLEFASPQERYDFGVDLLRQERFTEALNCLEAALKSGETAPLRYALALAAGNIGDPGAAIKHFRRACELDAGTRATARADAAFQNLLQFAEFRDAIVERG